MSHLERKKSIIGYALVGFAILLMGVLIFQNFQASIDRDAAQSSAQTSAQQKKNLAEEVASACQAGEVLKSSTGVDLCARAATIAQQPVTIEGPQGPAGPRGLPGIDGADGKTGAAGSAGKAGPSGDTGATGADGIPGADGDDGAAGMTGPRGVKGETGGVGPPGPAGAKGDTGATGAVGPAGADGANGLPGSSPESFTFTDATGATYSCTPDPPGSLTYTCKTPNQPQEIPSP